jgi:hypothetical protein
MTLAAAVDVGRTRSRTRYRGTTGPVDNRACRNAERAERQAHRLAGEDRDD